MDFLQSAHRVVNAAYVVFVAVGAGCGVWLEGGWHRAAYLSLCQRLHCVYSKHSRLTDMDDT